MKRFLGIICVGLIILSIGAGVANADKLGIKLTDTQGTTNSWVYCKHIEGALEEYDGANDGFPPAKFPPYIKFYSNNPVAVPYIELGTDSRPLHSLSTYTCLIKGIDITEPDNSTLTFYKWADGNFQGNNVMADIYENIGTESDPNYVHVIKLDAIKAILYPNPVPDLVIPVKNGISHILQIKYFPPEDVNFSGTVDLADFSTVSAYWGTVFGTNVRTAYSPTDHPEYYTDINKDGTVDILDLAELCSYWLWEKPVYEIDQYDPIGE